MTEPRTEAPTPRRLRRARREGDVATSRLLTGAAVFMAVVAGLALFGDELVRSTLALARASFVRGATEGEALMPLLWQAAGSVLTPLLKILALTLAAALLASLLQVGPLVSWRPWRPDFSRLAPAHALERFRRQDTFGRLLQGILAVVLLTGLTTALVRAHWQDALRLTLWPAPTAVAGAAEVSWRWALLMGVGLTCLGVLDLALERARHRRRLRMTRYEVDQEQRETVGDRRFRQERRQRHRIVAAHDPVEAVRQSTVLVTGPHCAAALYYDARLGDAPRLLTSGRNDYARRLARNARRHGVPQVYAPALADQLQAVPVARPIPVALYNDVATVLSPLLEREAAFDYQRRR